jgi:hypothetical protein
MKVKMMKLWMQTPYSHLTLTLTPFSPLSSLDTLALAARHNKAMDLHAKSAYAAVLLVWNLIMIIRKV